MKLSLRRFCRHNRHHNFYRSFHNFIESNGFKKHRRTVLVCFMIVVMFLSFYLFVYFTRFDRIKILVLDEQEDLINSSQQGYWKIGKSWNFVEKSSLSKLSKDPNSLSSIDRLKKESSFGFWVKTSNENDRQYDNSNKIVLDHFQYMYPLETSMGLRFFIEGDGKIEISYRDAFSWTTKTYVISSSPPFWNSKAEAGAAGNTLFCSHIVPLMFNVIDKIEIKATISKDKESFVAVDRVITTMGKHGGSRNLIITMMPTNWCNEYRYKYTWDAVMR